MRAVTAILLVIPFLFTVSGCASNKGKVLNERVNVLTNEVARLDGELRQTSAALQAQQEKNRTLETQLAQTRTIPTPSSSAGAGTSQGGAGVYRTPSGFELSSTDIQIALKNAGYYHGEVDGKVGPSARSAIRDFQRDNGLVVDGVCGRGTWEKLKVYLTVSK